MAPSVCRSAADARDVLAEETSLRAAGNGLADVVDPVAALSRPVGVDVEELPPVDAVPVQLARFETETLGVLGEQEGEREGGDRAAAPPFRHTRG
ncbi:MAG: hypothetical protein ACKVP5_07775 [Aestuariivirga sp.]